MLNHDVAVMATRTLLSMRAAAPNANTGHRFAVTRWRSELNSNCRYRSLDCQ